MGARQSTEYKEFAKKTRNISAKASLPFFITTFLGALIIRLVVGESTNILGVPLSIIYFSIIIGILHYPISLLINLLATKSVCKRTNIKQAAKAAIAPSVTSLVIGVVCFILLVVPIPIWKNVMMVITSILGENVIFLVALLVSIFTYITSMIAVTTTIKKTCQPTG